jgi:hypothetical protein
MKNLSLIAALLLAGCGKGNNDVPLPPLPPPAVDAFYTQVLAQIAVSPEDAEAGTVDALVATAPEDSEPQQP